MNISSVRINANPLCSSLPCRRFNWLRAFMVIVSLLVATACSTPQKEDTSARIQIESNFSGCTAESVPVEKMVCEDKKLQELHAELQDIYLRLQAIPQARALARETWQSWLRIRNGCPHEQCVEMVYRLRIDRMRMALNECERDKRWMQAMARPTEHCQKSLADLEITKRGGIMPMSSVKPLELKSYGKLIPTKKTGEAPGYPQIQNIRTGRRSNSNHLEKTIYSRKASSVQDRDKAKEIKPGFDCNLKLNYSEKLICSDSYLSSLDNHLNILYRKYQEITLSPETLKGDQLRWLKKRNSCREYSCIAEIYNIRISEIIRETKKIDSGYSVSSGNVYD